MPRRTHILQQPQPGGHKRPHSSAECTSREIPRHTPILQPPMQFPSADTTQVGFGYVLSGLPSNGCDGIARDAVGILQSAAVTVREEGAAAGQALPPFTIEPQHRTIKVVVCLRLAVPLAALPFALVDRFVVAVSQLPLAVWFAVAREAAVVAARHLHPAHPGLSSVGPLSVGPLALIEQPARCTELSPPAVPLAPPPATSVPGDGSTSQLSLSMWVAVDGGAVVCLALPSHARRLAKAPLFAIFPAARVGHLAVSGFRPATMAPALLPAASVAQLPLGVEFLPQAVPGVVAPLAVIDKCALAEVLAPAVSCAALPLAEIDCHRPIR
mmetsp:Transcript_18160/g.51663  ORF Transcript_18160/g.51663 Transcript_18160/m.51663 type:complete len:327 (-) Transcript_18160:571-1551(-)